MIRSRSALAVWLICLAHGLSQCRKRAAWFSFPAVPLINSSISSKAELSLGFGVLSARVRARFSDVCSKAVEHSGDKSRNGTFRMKCAGEGTAFYRQSENKVYERLGRKSRDRAAAWWCPICPRRARPVLRSCARCWIFKAQLRNDRKGEKNK